MSQYLGWGLGKLKSYEYIVREAAARLCLLRASTGDNAYPPGTPLEPRLWEDNWTSATPSRGLRCIERRWTAAWVDGAHQSRVRDREELEAGQVQGRNLRFSGETRAQPRSVPPPNPGRTAPTPPDDTVDLLAVPETLPQVPWRHVWARIQGVLTSRVQRALAWRLLHASVFCGAFRGYINPDIPEADRCCPRPCCASQPETLTHLFLTCPVSARVIRWVCDVWAGVMGGVRPVASAAVFLGDDTRVWDPGTEYGDLWTRVRLATLHAIWSAACLRRKGVVRNSASIAAKIVWDLRGAMDRDWQRTQEDVRLHASILSDWLRGRDTCISREHFQHMWGPLGGFYTLVPSPLPHGEPTLRILFSDRRPIPVPHGGEHF